MATALEISGLTKRFLQPGSSHNGGRPRRAGEPPRGADGAWLDVLRDVSLSVGRREFVSLLGPSGCGKSTLCNIVAGLVAPDAGVVVLDGTPVRPSDRGRVAYMQQKDLLLPWRTVVDNAILGMEIRGTPRAAARVRAREMLCRFGLEGFERAYPALLSGGMRQRVALVRTLLCDREVLVLDEPFGALDAMTRAAMQGHLLRLREEFGRTVLLVTHDVEEAILLSDRIYVLTPRPGRVQAELRVDLPRPRRATDAGVVRTKAEILDLLKVEFAEAPA